MRSDRLRYSSLLLGVLVSLTTKVELAHAQYIGPGSTPAGDYLRGVGIAAAGMGSYNFNTARANEINTRTAIGWNEYLAAVAKNQSEELARRRAAIARRNRENYEMILLRIKETPEERDVENGDTLNALTQQILDPAISSSTVRTSPIPLPGEVVRRIPFAFGPANVTFSMQRLSAKNNWPVGLRGPELAPQRREYEQAFDAALEQIVEGKGKLSREAIVKVETAISDLRDRLDRVVTPSRDKVYLEAKNFLARLEAGKELLKLHAIEPMLGEIDKYSGTTVYDLLEFMRKYKLRFGVAEIGQERDLYPRVYAALQAQLGRIGPAGAAPGAPGVLPPEPQLPPVEDRREEPPPGGV